MLASGLGIGLAFMLSAQGCGPQGIPAGKGQHDGERYQQTGAGFRAIVGSLSDRLLVNGDYGGPEFAGRRRMLFLWLVFLRQHGGRPGDVAGVDGIPVLWSGTASVRLELVQMVAMPSVGCQDGDPGTWSEQAWSGGGVSAVPFCALRQCLNHRVVVAFVDQQPDDSTLGSGLPVDGVVKRRRVGQTGIGGQSVLSQQFAWRAGGFGDLVCAVGGVVQVGNSWL